MGFASVTALAKELYDICDRFAEVAAQAESEWTVRRGSIPD